MLLLENVNPKNTKNIVKPCYILQWWQNSEYGQAPVLFGLQTPFNLLNMFSSFHKYRIN